MAGLTVRRGDTYLSPTWAIVLDSEPVDLQAGWTVRAQARTKDGVVVVDFGAGTDGTDVLLGTAGVEVGDEQVTTSTIRLYLSPEATAALTPRTSLSFDIEIENATYGPHGDLYRATVVSDVLAVVGDVTRPA
jgi:hypothetical protein